MAIAGISASDGMRGKKPPDVNAKRTNVFRFRLPRRSGFSPLRILKHLREKMAKALSLVSLRRRPSPKVSSKPFSATPSDSHRTEAIEDCIDFINSSSSLPRSISVAAKDSS